MKPKVFLPFLIRKRNIYSELTPLLLGQLISTGASLATVRILTGYLGPSLYGELSLALTYQVVANQLFFGPLGSASLRFTSEAQKNGTEKSFLLAQFRIFCKASLPISIGSFLFFALLSVFGKLKPNIGLLLLVLFSLGAGCLHVLVQFFNATRRRQVYGALLSTFSLLQCLLSTTCVVFFGASTSSVLLGYCLASTLSLFMAIFYLKPYAFKNLIPSIDFCLQINARSVLAWEKCLKDYAIKFSSWGFVTWLLLISDRWSLHIFDAYNSIGLYAVAYQLGYTPVALLCGLGMQLVTPILFSKVQNAGSPKVKLDNSGRLIVVISIFASLLIGLLFVFVTPILFDVFASPAFYGALQIAPPLSIAAGLFSAAEFIALVFQAELRINTLAKVKIFLACTGIVLNVIGAHWLGALGVAWSVAAYSLLQLTFLGGLRFKKLILASF
jgi:O-antigen/teichoic acid export membrane protein